MDLITREHIEGAEQGSLICILIIIFPVIEYDSVGNGTFKDVKNLLRRVALNTKGKIKHTSTILTMSKRVKHQSQLQINYMMMQNYIGLSC